MLKTFNISLNLENTTTYPRFTINQNDLNTVEVNMTLTINKKPVDLTGITPRIVIKKPSRLTVIQDCTVVNALKGNFKVILDTQAYSESGKHLAEVCLYEGQNKVSVTETFTYMSNEAILNDSTVTSSNEWQSINDAFFKLENIDIPGLQTDLDTVNTQVSKNIQKLAGASVDVVADFNASGSAQFTTGSINSGSNVLAVANVIDFKKGDGISIRTSPGIGEVSSLQITSTATATGEVIVTLGDIPHYIPVTSGDTVIQVADKIRTLLSTVNYGNSINTVALGWTVGGTAGTDTITFTSTKPGVRIDSTYSANSTGANGTMTTTTQGANPTYFVSKVTNINGNTITIQDTYSGTTLSNQVVNHDDTISVQAAIDYIATTYGNKGGTVVIPMGYTCRISQVRIKTKHIQLTGGGTIDGEVLVKSVDTATAGTFNISKLFTVIKNLRFVNTGNFIGSVGVRINNTWNATVKDCYFDNYEIGVYGESLVEDFQWQQTARVQVKDCNFWNTDYAVKTKFKPYYVGISPNWAYSQHGDWQVTGCYWYADFISDLSGLPSGVTAYHFEGQDGLIVQNNFAFHHQFTAHWFKKRYCLYIEQSNYVNVGNNNFFEPGYEGIRITNYRVMNIHDNHVTRAGQIKPRSGIFVETTDISGTATSSTLGIKNNHIYGTSKHGVEIGYNPILVRVDNNNMFGLGSNSTYYGSDTIPAQVYSTQVLYGGTPFANSEQVVVSNNFSDKPQNLQRGMRNNELYTPYVNVKATFGNIATTNFNISGTFNVRLNAGGESSFSFNQNFPQVFKDVTGNITDISAAGTCQILVLSAGAAGLTVTHSNTGANKVRLKGAANRTLAQYETITLIHTDDIWYEI